MMGTFNCVYETPCGWCSKWDKKCDRKIPPVDNSLKDALDTHAIQICSGESHEWECTGMSTAGTIYTCKRCGARKQLSAIRCL